MLWAHSAAPDPCPQPCAQARELPWEERWPRRATPSHPVCTAGAWGWCQAGEVQPCQHPRDPPAWLGHLSCSKHILLRCIDACPIMLQEAVALM